MTMTKPLKTLTTPSLLATLVLSCFLATACVPIALVAGGAAIGGAVIYDKRSTKVIAEDRDTSSKALNTLYDDQELRDNTRITVATFNQIL